MLRNFCHFKHTLSLAEALLLATDAGIVTRREVQAQIVKSPSFSRDKSPFLINNPLKDINAESQENDAATADSPEIRALVPILESHQQTNLGPLDHLLASYGDRPFSKMFWHANEWWLHAAEAMGTCKRSTAAVRIERGSGNVTVNKNEDLYWRWHRFYNRMDVIEPLYRANAAAAFDVYICVHGGGTSGQAKAARLALAKAIVKANPACKTRLGDALVEDIRQKMPKMPGRIGARAQRKWRKR